MKKIKLITPILTLATISSSLIPLTSCNKKEDKPAVESLTIIGEEIVDQQSSGTQYYVFDSSWSTIDVEWKVDNTSIATIDSTGLLKPVASGNVKITATSKTDSTQIGALNVLIADSWTEFKQTWAEYNNNFSPTIDKYNSITIDPNHNIWDYEVATTGEVVYKETKTSRASLWFDSGYETDIIAVSISRIESMLKRQISLNNEVELINNKSQKIIGYKIYEQGELVNFIIWNSELYLAQFWDYSSQKGAVRADLKITSYNE